MRTNPIFCGIIHVKEVKNDTCYLSEFKTSAKSDAEIDKFVKSINLDMSSILKQKISKENGKAFWNLIEKVIGKKLEISDNVDYSALCDNNFVLFMCQEISNSKGPKIGDRTLFDIHI